MVKYTDLHINPVFGGHGISGPGKSGFYCIIPELEDSIFIHDYRFINDCTTFRLGGERNPHNFFDPFLTSRGQIQLLNDRRQTL